MYVVMQCTAHHQREECCQKRQDLMEAQQARVGAQKILGTPFQPCLLSCSAQLITSGRCAMGAKRQQECLTMAVAGGTGFLPSSCRLQDT